ncbi:SRPBCC family protein [Nocardia panacis]|uniref:SRPBCC family protein n=1 Tax=Nocardia panacis TaxID=2340916 RepID=A0A3A4K7V8_9NOCA|nr:SRPBCC family protein [Nocardia panacis]RJO70787.1 SRPBCC family protein [Nocardia panacis]
MVLNIHSRVIAADVEAVGRLLDTLATDDDRLWPVRNWPAMRFDRPLAVGADGGHGLIRYTCIAFDRGREVVFRFNSPRGFDGTHRWLAEKVDDQHTRLTHEILMDPHGWDRLAFPLAWRWLHDALIEDGLDLAEAELVPGTPPRSRHSAYVRFLRGLVHSDKVRE